MDGPAPEVLFLSLIRLLHGPNGVQQGAYTDVALIERYENLTRHGVDLRPPNALHPPESGRGAVTEAAQARPVTPIQPSHLDVGALIVGPDPPALPPRVQVEEGPAARRGLPNECGWHCGGRHHIGNHPSRARQHLGHPLSDADGACRSGDTQRQCAGCDTGRVGRRRPRRAGYS
jgi:hypothetical protein